VSALARLRDPKTWLALVTLVAVLFLVLEDTQRAASPGPLTQAHAAVPELAGAAGCEVCHASAAGGALSGGCTSCHTAIGEQLAASSGFHGALTGVKPTDCGRCHVEHHGDEAQLVDARAFQLAGVPDRARFDHAFTQFTLSGAHAQLECARCHANADAERLEKGQARFVGASQRCASCHADPHRGQFDSDCASCHGQSSFTELTGFQHTEAFPLSGNHAGLACASCHVAGSPHAIEVVGAASYAEPPRACAACHASPHATEFLAQVAADARLEVGNSCASCHAALDGSFAPGAARMDAAAHAATGFELRGAHASLACASCHSGDSAGFTERFRGRPQACASCHDDPHGGQFGRETNCASCHGAQSWKPSLVDAAAHTSFPLRGAHATASCEACHAASPSGARVFRGAELSCEACHVDVHERRFERQLALVASEARAAGGSCGLCHEPTRFAQVDAARFEHAHWTGFELVGAHAALSCETCHPRAATADEHGRSFGRVQRTGAAELTHCANCHADVHRGAFDALGVRGDFCASCHTAHGFAAGRATFDHATSGFALEGAHQTASCEACHGTRAPSDDLPRSLGFVTEQRARGAADPRTCSACHAQVHEFHGAAAQATKDAALECARCHTTSSFADRARANFDHAAWAGFPLQGAHASTACEACHVPTAQGAAHVAKLGRAAGTDCAACHVDVHRGQFEREGRTDCARCHDPSRPLGEVRFDHQRDARFALDANHRKLDCSACHKPWPTPDGRSVVRYKPLGVECADCHGVSGKKDR
jgi:hypothetical protein